MRRLVPVFLLAIAVPLSAQVHEATPLNVLLDRFGIPHNHDMAGMQANGEVKPLVPTAVSAATAKTFNVTARQFEFDFSPSPFVVNVGDDVTLNISVPSTDEAPHGHSFFLETYMTDAVPIAHGRSVTIHFVATAPGTFTFLCLQSDCGTGHTNMNGILTVNAAAAGPAITSISPASGSVAGGTTVTIKGSGFAAGATAKIGLVAATNVNVVDANTITAVTAAVAPTEETGLPVDVVVTNPDGTTATLKSAFTYTIPPVSLSSLQPDGSPTTGGTTVTIVGGGFTSATKTTVTFGGVAATEFRIVSSTVMTVTAPPHPAGTVDVVVSVGSASATLEKAFTYADATLRRRSARK